MPSPRNIFRAAASFTLLALCLSPAFARGGGGGGHGGGHASTSVGAAKTAAASTTTNSSKAKSESRGHMYGGRGGRGGYYPGNQQTDADLDKDKHVMVGQQFSGPAHISPSQYGQFVQSYSWPAHSAAQTQGSAATAGGEPAGQPVPGN